MMARTTSAALGRCVAAAVLGAVAAVAAPAEAGGPTPGYPEPVIQWGVQKGETCEGIAKSLYGSEEHVDLILRYNRVECRRGTPLGEGTTLVVPESVTTVPSAHIRSAHPRVRARPPGGGWSPAAAGLPLESNSSVNTLEEGRADIEFVDRTRVFLAQNTLVVLYGATASKSRVSKSSPPSVEVQEGEVKAGLAALRGGAALVNVPGGGRVEAVSRETVVERKGARTTVAVFDGKARVASGGRSVDVPLNHGTRFVGAAKPAPPRPLPPAPSWEAGGSSVVVLAGADGATLRGGWAEVPGALRYRVEIARDEAFGDLVVRQEVPATVRSFRAEKMPAGTYRVAVRAIDREEYLGVATIVRRIEVIDARVEGKGALGDDAIEVSRYATLALGVGADVEVALDGGPFGPLPARVDLAERTPAALVLRRKGAPDAAEVALRYVDVAARIERAGYRVLVQLDGVDDAQARARVRPSLRVHAEGAPVTLALAPEGAARFAASLGEAAASVTRLDVVDGAGRILGSRTDTVAPTAARPHAAAVARRRRIGLDTAPAGAASLGPTPAWSPTARSQASIATIVDRAGGAWGASGQARVVGAFDDGGGSSPAVGVEAALRTDVSGEGRSDDPSAWFGVRARLWQSDAGIESTASPRWELGPALRLAVPVTASGIAPRLEPALGVGVGWGRWTAILDGGARLRLASDDALPPVQALAVLGATYDPATMVRAGAIVDASLMRALGGDALRARGGMALALEVGGPWFAGISGRVSPWSDGETPLAVQLTVGLREAP